MIHNFNGDLIKFDIDQIPILDLVLNYFKMNSIDEIFLKLNNEELYKKLYKLEKTEKFSNCYKSLVKIIAKELGNDDFYFQRIPSFRAHRVEEKTVDYHTDVMYGHGENVLNFWVPLRDTNAFNSLCLSDKNKNEFLLKRYEDERLSIKDANKFFRDNSNPCLARYGEIIVFRSDRIHGSEVNNSNQNRLSFDFRVLPSNSNPGTKSLDDFYVSNISHTKQFLKKTPCIFYLHKRNPIMKNCSHYVQDEINKMYANENSLIHNGLAESEIYGKNHYPVIFHFVNEKIIDNIVMASILCLPSNFKLRNELLLSAKNNGVVLHFSMENKKNINLSIDGIHKYYEYLLNAEKILNT